MGNSGGAGNSRAAVGTPGVVTPLPCGRRCASADALSFEGAFDVGEQFLPAGGKLRPRPSDSSNTTTSLYEMPSASRAISVALASS